MGAVVLAAAAVVLATGGAALAALPGVEALTIGIGSSLTLGSVTAGGLLGAASISGIASLALTSVNAAAQCLPGRGAQAANCAASIAETVGSALTLGSFSAFPVLAGVIGLELSLAGFHNFSGEGQGASAEMPRAHVGLVAPAAPSLPMRTVGLCILSA